MLCRFPFHCHINELRVPGLCNLHNNKKKVVTLSQFIVRHAANATAVTGRPPLPPTPPFLFNFTLSLSCFSFLPPHRDTV